MSHARKGTRIYAGAVKHALLLLGLLTTLTVTPARANPSLVWVENHLAFECYPDCGFDLWQMAPDGSDARITASSSTGNVMYPDWTRDGSRIAYVYEHFNGEPGKERSELRVMSPDLSGDRVIVTASAESSPAKNLVQPDWSADERRIVYALYYPNPVWGESNLWTVSPDGTDRRQLTSLSGSETQPVFSPDGKRVFFIRVSPYEYEDPSAPPTGGHLTSIWSVAADGSDLQQHVWGDAMVSTSNVTFSPQGDRFAFIGGLQVGLFTASTDDGTVEHIDAGSRLGDAAWSPDARFLAFQRDDLDAEPGGNVAIGVVSSDPLAGEPRVLRRQGSAAEGLNWISGRPMAESASADGRPPAVTLARVQRGRNGQPLRTIFGAGTDPDAPRRISVRRARQLAFVALDGTGLRRVAVTVKRRSRPGRAVARKVIRTEEDWTQLKQQLRRGTYLLRFRTSDTAGNAGTSRALKLRVKR